MAIAEDATGGTARESGVRLRVNDVPAGAIGVIERSTVGGGVGFSEIGFTDLSVGDPLVYFDPLPLTTTLYYYRARTREAGKSDSAAATAEVSTRAKLY
jgi:hypothetical protein